MELGRRPLTGRIRFFFGVFVIRAVVDRDGAGGAGTPIGGML